MFYTVSQIASPKCFPSFPSAIAKEVSRAHCQKAATTMTIFDRSAAESFAIGKRGSSSLISSFGKTRLEEENMKALAGKNKQFSNQRIAVSFESRLRTFTVSPSCLGARLGKQQPVFGEGQALWNSSRAIAEEATSGPCWCRLLLRRLNSFPGLRSCWGISYTRWQRWSAALSLRPSTLEAKTGVGNLLVFFFV